MTRSIEFAQFKEKKNVSFFSRNFFFTQTNTDNARATTWLTGVYFDSVLYFCFNFTLCTARRTKDSIDSPLFFSLSKFWLPNFHRIIFGSQNQNYANAHPKCTRTLLHTHAVQFFTEFSMNQRFISLLHTSNHTRATPLCFFFLIQFASQIVRNCWTQTHGVYQYQHYWFSCSLCLARARVYECEWIKYRLFSFTQSCSFFNCSMALWRTDHYRFRIDTVVLVLRIKSAFLYCLRCVCSLKKRICQTTTQVDA